MMTEKVRITLSMLDKTYSRLIRLDTFDERLEYLLLHGHVGENTFGFDRYLNQEFYRSYEWRRVRDEVIVRDNGCDLAVPGFDIPNSPLVHHMIPITPNAIAHGESWIIDPQYLITTTQRTHNTIHFGFDSPESREIVERTPGDTKLW